MSGAFTTAQGARNDQNERNMEQIAAARCQGQRAAALVVRLIGPFNLIEPKRHDQTSGRSSARAARRAMSTSAALLRRRAPADTRCQKLGATRLADPQVRRPFAGAPLRRAPLRGSGSQARAHLITRIAGRRDERLLRKRRTRSALRCLDLHFRHADTQRVRSATPLRRACRRA